jgi:NADH-quinone oxidoreductase subunit M
MLLALIGIYWLHGDQTGVYTFSLDALTRTPVQGRAGVWLYAAFLLAFAIKIPVIPVHNWLPDTHTEAPTAGSVVLAGLLLKTGAYGLFRFAFPLFPAAAKASVPLLLVLGVGGAFYAALIALAQTDLKRLVAYSSIGHMGYIVIGLGIGNLMTTSGALLQMVNHGLTTGALFILVGMLDERLGSRQLADMGGLWGRMPAFSAFFLLFALSSLGLPGLNNFVGEMLILIGAFKARPLVAILGFAGLVCTVIYILRMVQDALFGEARKEQEVWDLTPREVLILGALALAIFFIGLHPGPVLKLFEAPALALLPR